MARHRNCDWNLPDGSPKPDGHITVSWECIQSALLMDIRDELQAINRVLGCSNFTAIPRLLCAIEKNTTRAKRKKGG